nr:6-phosphogluconate dehydratase [Lachnospiraceae bacterium]
IAKCRGEKKLIDTTLSEIKKAGYKGGKLRICHVENDALARSITEGLRSAFGDIDVISIPAAGLCSFYAERSGIIIGVECG